MLWEQKVEFAALSDVGFRRRNNQDSYSVLMAQDRAEWDARGHLFLVADGMGGHAVGELASKIASDTIPHAYSKISDLPLVQALRSAVLQGNSAIFERAALNTEFSRMGTTCTTLVLSPEGALLGHVGDSRCYRIRRGQIEQLTFDHSLQWELLRQGRMSAEEIFRNEPRNVITRSLGPQAQVEVDVEGPYAIEAGDVYVLCSDGLTGHVGDPEIGAIAGSLAPTEACRMLVNLANVRGGSDNITALIVRVGAAPEAGESNAEGLPGWGSWSWSRRMLLAVWLALWGLVLLLFVGGLRLVPTESGVVGHVMTAAANLLAVLLLFALWWYRQREVNRPLQIELTPGTPYRRANAQLGANFVSELVRLENALQRTAQEDGWPVDWNEYHAVFRQADAQLTAQRYPETLRLLARGLQLLMDGLLQLRRQRDQTQRWGGQRPPGSAEPPAGPVL